MSGSRREFLQRSGLLLTFTAGAGSFLLTPAQAYAENMPLQVLSAAEADTLAAIAETLVPGATAAGVSHFVDHQLAQEPGDCLLMLKYLGVAMADFRGFYQTALTAADGLAQRLHDASWGALNAQQANELLAAISGPDPEGWQGPPAGFFTFVLRSDACDVVYGTEEGFARIGMPYMAHIMPTARW